MTIGNLSNKLMLTSLVILFSFLSQVLMQPEKMAAFDDLSMMTTGIQIAK